MSTKSKASKTSTNNFDPMDYAKPGVSLAEVQEVR